MKVSVISDVHIHPDKTGGIGILRKFCSSEKVLTSDVVVLLGDIFDLMVYDFDDYLDLYEDSFLQIEGLLKKGIQVVFVEGNHDFCVKRILLNRFKGRNFNYYKNGFFLNIESKKIAFYHGDTIEIDNAAYCFYRSIIKSAVVQSFYESFVRFKKTWSIGSYLLARSHDRHEKYAKTYNSEEVREKFRKSAIKYFNNNKVDYLVCGHSHIKDAFRFEDHMYYNNGYAQSENTCLYFDGFDFSFIEI